MKRPLLDIVQEILNEMDSDEVNSIDDTTESQQVANIVKSCYFEMISNRTWDHLKKMSVFDSAADINRPTHLRSPENMRELIFFNYDKTRQSDTTTKYGEVLYKYPDEFMRLVSGRNTNSPTVKTVTDTTGTKLFIITDQPPSYWTSFDDQYIVCDSYDSMVDTTLQSSKTQIYALFDATWTHLDNAVPNLPTEAFSALVEESKSTAFLALKQVANQKAEQKAKRQQQWLSRKQWTNHGGVRYDNYGRRGRK